MCFGNQQTTNTTNTTQTYTPSAWLQAAAQGNLGFAQQLQQNGFTPYSGQQVANFSPQQLQSFGMGGNVAGAAAQNAAGGGNALTQYLNTASNGEPTVQAESIASQMSPYMNQYVSQALAPQLAAAQNQQALNQQEMQGQATSAGAFGDPRANLLQSNQQLVNNLSNQGLVGNAYNAAFNTAIGAGAQDVANNLNAQTTNAGLYNTGLQNLLAGSNTAYSQGAGGTNLLNTLGGQQTQQNQAQLNALYNQWLMGQQYPFQTTQLMNQTLGAASVGSPSTTTGTSVTQQPNNAGFGILGSLGGAAINALPMFFAAGGAPPVNQPSIVGEKGPEIFVPKQSGTVVPYEKVKEAINKKAGLSTKNFQGKPGAPGYAFGGSPPTGLPSLVGENGPEMFVPNGGLPSFAGTGSNPFGGAPSQWLSSFMPQGGAVSPQMAPSSGQNGLPMPPAVQSFLNSFKQNPTVSGLLNRYGQNPQTSAGMGNLPQTLNGYRPPPGIGVGALPQIVPHPGVGSLPQIAPQPSAGTNAAIGVGNLPQIVPQPQPPSQIGVGSLPQIVPHPGVGNLPQTVPGGSFTPTMFGKAA